MLHKLQYISQGKNPKEHHENIYSVLDSGATLVQLRLKNVSDEEYTDYAYKTKELCSKYNSILIINDNPKVAREVNAEAVHLGLDDMKIEEAKKVAPGKIFGGTANTFEHIKQRFIEQVNYVGLGPFRFTTTKEKLSPILGTKGYADILKIMESEGINLPVYAIGGIELNDLHSIMSTGVYGVAVSGLLTSAANKEKLIKEINKYLYHA